MAAEGPALRRFLVPGLALAAGLALLLALLGPGPERPRPEAPPEPAAAAGAAAPTAVTAGAGDAAGGTGTPGASGRIPDRTDGEPRVKGRVVDLAERPVAGAEVLAWPERPDGSPAPVAVTDPEGRFEAPASAGLLVRAPGYASRRVEADELWEGPVVLHPGSGLSGVVVFGSGRPAAGAVVKLVTVGTEIVMTETAGEDGRFRFRGLDGEEPADLVATLGDLEAEADWVGPGREDLVLRLGPAREYGSLVIHANAPEGARLTFSEIRDPESGWGWGGDVGPDRDGLRYPRVAAGTYDVLLDYSAEEDLPQGRRQLSRYGARGRVAVRGGEEATIGLVPEERLRSFACVRVLDADGAPTREVLVRAGPALYPGEWRDPWEDQSPAPDGRCAMPVAAPPGTSVEVTVHPRAAAGLTATRPIRTSATPSGTPAEIRLPGGARLAIRVTGLAGWPVGLMEVWLPEGGYARADPGEPGLFRAEVQPGRPFSVEVKFRDGTWDYPPLTGSFEGLPAGTHDIALTLPARQAPVPVGGRLRSAAGNRVGNSCHVLRRAGGADPPDPGWNLGLDDSGEFTLGELLPGPWELIVWSEDLRARARVAFEVEGEDPIDLGEIRLAPVPLFRGRVLDESGRPRSGVDLELYAADRDGWSPLAQGYSRADGSFELPLYLEVDLFLEAEMEGEGPEQPPLLAVLPLGADPAEAFHTVRLARACRILARLPEPVRLRAGKPEVEVRDANGILVARGGKPEQTADGRLAAMRLWPTPPGTLHVRVRGWTAADEPYTAEATITAAPGETLEAALQSR